MQYTYIDKDFLDISLEHVKKDILATLINISSNFNRFKANIMLEIDLIHYHQNH